MNLEQLIKNQPKQNISQWIEFINSEGLQIMENQVLDIAHANGLIDYEVDNIFGDYFNIR